MFLALSWEMGDSLQFLFLLRLRDWGRCHAGPGLPTTGTDLTPTPPDALWGFVLGLGLQDGPLTLSGASPRSSSAHVP